jgi:hypothetical protein
VFGPQYRPITALPCWGAARTRMTSSSLSAARELLPQPADASDTRAFGAPDLRRLPNRVETHQGRAGRFEQPVPALPDSKYMLANGDPTAQLPDTEQTRRVSSHAPTIQILDTLLTNLAGHG